MGNAAADPSREGASPEILSRKQGDTRPRPEGNLRARHRSRLFETTSTLGEVLGDGGYSSQCAWKGTRLQYFNMGRSPLIHRGSELSPGEPTLEEPFSQAIFPFLFSSRGPIQVRSVKLLLPCCTHEAITLSRETC